MIRNVDQANNNNKEACVTLLLSNERDLKAKSDIWDKDNHHIYKRNNSPGSYFVKSRVLSIKLFSKLQPFREVVLSHLPNRSDLELLGSVLFSLLFN